jgi:hypothetical protein
MKDAERLNSQNLRCSRERPSVRRNYNELEGAGHYRWIRTGWLRRPKLSGRQVYPSTLDIDGSESCPRLSGQCLDYGHVMRTANRYHAQCSSIRAGDKGAATLRVKHNRIRSLSDGNTRDDARCALV